MIKRNSKIQLDVSENGGLIFSPTMFMNSLKYIHMPRLTCRRRNGLRFYSVSWEADRMVGQNQLRKVRTGSLKEKYGDKPLRMGKS